MGAVDPQPRRHFSSSERIALYLAADGRCSLCGTDLPRSWHADHVIPWSKGGPTDITNGQALCAACNLTKGDKIMNLSEWQERALVKYQSSVEDFLAVACPGAGKTRLALAAAASSLAAGFDKLLVIVPTSHLRIQWASAAAHSGIQLDPTFENGHGVPNSEFDGVVITYAALASEPLLYARMVNDRTLVILDEVHHLGDSAAWGQAARQALSNAGRRLMLSGTPARTDGTEIPFVQYDEEGRFVAQETYSYGDAQTEDRIDADGTRYPVVRRTLFRALDGTSRWISAREAEVHITQNLADASDATMANALAAALKPSGDWIPSVIAQANDELTRYRERTPDAGGLIVAPDQGRARAYARIIRQITGEEAALVISDEPGASAEIKRFADGASRWIVAVAMVSEGVDIPRLTTVVYATRIRAELFFRQVIGRVVRCRGPQDATRATVFLPSIEPLVKIAAQIEDVNDHALREREARESRLDVERANPAEVTILGSSEARDYATIVSGVQLTDAEIEAAAARLARHGLTGDAVDAALFIRELSGAAQPATQTVPRDTVKPLHEQRKELRDDITKLVGKVALHCYGSHTRAGDVRYDLKVRGFPSPKDASFDQLVDMRTLLVDCLDNRALVV